MNPTPDIIEKIKKLLRLGADKAATPQEAELAVQRAYELAARHQVDIENVSLEDDVRKIISENFPHPGRVSFARKKLLNILCAFFNVNVVIRPVPAWARSLTSRQPLVTFIGTTVDIQIARYVYEFLHRSCAAALREYVQSRSRRPAASTQKQFVLGFCYGVGSKLHAAKAQLSEHHNALIVHESARRDQFEQAAFADQRLTTVKTDPGRRNEAAVHAGFVEGERVEIRKPITTNAAGQLLLA